ncbi:UNKNOWN [Stylonychia lemnae]|uniref:TOG domain-containing protein n=1 Tax=Stylonychia lemnae TaxID=5949 RepID=A0A078A4A3_STYLE|nr:UNKNOWN [Stylonychia lemnae]|eukprot:CDW76992.1 UNKNOWN [Stylonychia lemnae]
MANHKLQKLTYRVLYCTGEDPIFPVTELLYNSPQCKGWTSAKFCEYPQEIIVQFTHLVRLREIQILTHQNKIPSKIELFSFLPSGFQALQGELPLNKIQFEKLGYLDFDSNEKTKYQAREMKSAYVDSMAMLLKFNIFSNHQNKLNLFNQVSIIAVNCLGEHYVPPSGLREPIPIGGRFEEEMQYDPSTIEKLKQLYTAKKSAVIEGDYERAIKIKNAIERMKAIGIKLNELVDKKRQALDKQDFNLAKKLTDEIQALRTTVLNARLQFEDTSQLKPLSREWSRKEVQRIVETDNHRLFDKIQLTTETIMRNPKNLLQPQLDQDKKQIGNQQPITTDELAKKLNSNRPPPMIGGQGQVSGMGGEVVNVDEMVIPTHTGKSGHFSIPEYDESSKQNTEEDLPVGKSEDLTEDDMKSAAPLIPVFGMEIIKKIYSADWHLREKAIQEVIEEVTKGTKSQICGHIEQERLFTSCFGVIAQTICDKIASVSISASAMIIKVCKEIYPTITLNVKGELNSNLKQTFNWMLDKIGDNNGKVRETTEEAALVMAGHPAIGTQNMIEQITKGQVKKSALNSVKHNSGKLNLLKKILQTYKVKQNWEVVSEFAIKHLQDGNATVRVAAYAVLLELYLLIGKPLMSEFIDLSPHKLDIINRSFAEADKGDIQAAYQVIGLSNSTSKTNTSVGKSMDLKSSQKISRSMSKKSFASSKFQPGKCNFCDIENEEFDRQEVLEIHYFEDCRFFAKCQYCQMQIEINDMQNHWLSDCVKKDELRQCQRCKEVMHENKFEKHTVDNKCTPNPTNDVMCPLCGINISKLGPGKIEDKWKQHINKERCSKNPRKK